MADRGDKTEKATPHKREEQRKKGNIFQSKDLITAITILLSFLGLQALSSFMFNQFYLSMSKYVTIGRLLDTLEIQDASNILFDVVVSVLILAMPIALIAAVLGIIMSLAQTRFVMPTDALKPKFSRLNPIEGIKKMFSLKGLVELVKSLLKIAIIALIVYNEISKRMNTIPMLITGDIFSAVAWIGDAVISVAVQAGLGMLAIGVMDYFYQWWEYERSLRMSKQEIKDEYKQTEGDPQTKSRIRSIQKKMATQRMMSQVKTADVVVRNPEHYAVALRYDNKTERAPVVVAKGKDQVALRIIKEAEKYKIATRENPPLARTLYATVEINAEIPEEFYAAVVEILLYLDKFKKRFKK